MQPQHTPAQAPALSTTKTCSHCGEVKPRTDFYHNRSRRDGLHYECKVCFGRAREPAVASVRDKACTKCGLLQPLEDFPRKRNTTDGRTSQCRTCSRAQWRLYRQNNASAVRERQRAWKEAQGNEWPERQRAYYWADPERYRAYARAGYARDPERHRSQARDHVKRHPERVKRQREESAERNRQAISVRTRRYRLLNQERRSAYLKEWIRRNPARVRQHYHARRARLAGGGGSYTVHDLRLLYEAQAGLCLYCMRPLEGVFVIDHKTALSRGGSNGPDNLALCCDHDNARKGTRSADEYRALLASEE